jgi:hypothetical protein
MEKNEIWVPGSRINIRDHISESLAFFWVKNNSNSLMRIRDPVPLWPWLRNGKIRIRGSGMNIPDLQHCAAAFKQNSGHHTLAQMKKKKKKKTCLQELPLSRDGWSIAAAVVSCYSAMAAAAA